MIELLDLLLPATSMEYTYYQAAAQIDWLHSENRQLISDNQVYPSSGPASVIPTAIFTIVQTGTPNVWSGVEW